MVTAEDVRAIALALPETAERLAWGMPTFRVGGATGKGGKAEAAKGGKIFAALADDDASMGVKCPREERAELIATEPEKFFVRPGHDDNYDWLRVRLAAIEDTAELRAILTDAWRQAAPRSVVDAHGGAEGSGGAGADQG
ncbi:MmcQ/YjbR family DNA-binding protein [Streptomyces syringium]|uniref:MmcQ/YjbR family DNA-binding protein n=1 Tax=Streptomyces syringium TaxID=76729 RepID=UPI0033C3B72D